MATISIKQILLSNQNWWLFYEKYKSKLRPSIVTNVVKLLSCKNTVRGYRLYHCSNPHCSHIKRVPHTPWQHITFTMPSPLWDFFWCNRQLLNQIGAIADFI